MPLNRTLEMSKLASFMFLIYFITMFQKDKVVGKGIGKEKKFLNDLYF